uniref:Uncharacterized protein n=1 Tax=Micrurus corallinus TaxID=54390 RepID=A0A2D4EXK8_MICCO
MLILFFDASVDKFIGKLIYSSVVSFTFILFCDPIMQKGKMLHQYLNGKREAVGGGKSTACKKNTETLEYAKYSALLLRKWWIASAAVQSRYQTSPCFTKQEMH